MQADSRAVVRMKRLRHEFGRGPVELVIPGRRMVIVLDPEDVGHVLAARRHRFIRPTWRNGKRCSGFNRMGC
jgi:hypothetical protein